MFTLCPASDYKYYCGKRCQISYGMVVCWYQDNRNNQQINKIKENNDQNKWEQIDHVLTYGE